MKKRGETPEGFSGLVSCESTLPQGVQTASIQGIRLPLQTARPKRMLVLGDTGCRIKRNRKGKLWAQNCDGKGKGPAWSFEKLARTAAGTKPDLIVHLGDYHYRESACSIAGCRNSPYGDAWAAWEADFFRPARKLLLQAPWIFVRGNHESCERAWKGWYYFLDPGPLPRDPWRDGNCRRLTPPLAYDFDGLRLIALDTAAGPSKYEKEYITIFNAANALAEKTPRPAWLFSHRPLRGITSYNDGQKKLGATELTEYLRRTKRKNISRKFRLTFAGHIHITERMRFRDGFPTTYIAGAGGTALDPAITPEMTRKGSAVFNRLQMNPGDFSFISGFTFLLITPTRRGFRARVIDEDGKTRASFSEQ